MCEDDSQIQFSSVLTGYKTWGNTLEESLDITTSLIQASCAMCPEKDDNNMIQCSICHHWLHFSCTKPPAYQFKIFISTQRKFTCENCVDQANKDLQTKCFDFNILEIMESKDKIINEKSLGSDRLNNEIILMKNRFEEIDNSKVKKKSLSTKPRYMMSVKIEDLKNTEENNTHLRKKSEKQCSVRFSIENKRNH